MKKQSKQLVILVVMLVALVAVFFGLKQYNKIQSENEEESTGEIVVDIAKDDIIKFTFDYNGETYTFEKEDDTWYYAEDHSLNITQYQISNMLNQVAPLQAEQRIENVTDMEQYGLAEPQKTISYQTADAEYVFEVGDYNSVSGVYYIRKPSEDTIYVVAPATVTMFNKALDDLVDEEESTEETTEETEAETETQAE